VRPFQFFLPFALLLSSSQAIANDPVSGLLKGLGNFISSQPKAKIQGDADNSVDQQLHIEGRFNNRAGLDCIQYKRIVQLSTHSTIYGRTCKTKGGVWLVEAEGTSLKEIAEAPPKKAWESELPKVEPSQKTASRKNEIDRDALYMEGMEGLVAVLEKEKPILVGNSFCFSSPYDYVGKKIAISALVFARPEDKGVSLFSCTVNGLPNMVLLKEKGRPTYFKGGLIPTRYVIVGKVTGTKSIQIPMTGPRKALVMEKIHTDICLGKLKESQKCKQFSDAVQVVGKK